MCKRPFYLLVIMCFLVSLLTGIMAQTKASQAARFAAVATEAIDNDDRQIFRNLSRRHLAEYHEVATTWMTIGAAGAVEWIVSSRRRESGLRIIPLGLIIFAIVIQPLLV